MTIEPYRLARNRVKKVLREHLVVASVRTLEVKLAERGPLFMQAACAPHIVTRAIAQLFDFEDICLVASPKADGLPDCPCNLIALTSVPASELTPALELRIYLERTYNDHLKKRRGPNTVGGAGEAAVLRAFELSKRFTVGHSWGDVKDPRISGAADGLLFSSKLPPDRAGILLEIKNWREWIYFDTYELWKHFRNAYAMDCIPLFIARRIYGRTFEYVFKRLGGLGIEMRAQYAPPSFEASLSDIVHSDGLDYYDLRFTTEPGPRFCKRIRALDAQVAEARTRLDRARPVAEPYVAKLADPRCPDRAAVYWQMQAALNKAGIEPLSLERPEAPT